MSDRFRLSKIGVIMVGVADAGKSTAFYRDRLGLTVTSQHESFVFLDAGGLTLGLSPGLAQAVGNIPGAVEIVFSVEHVRQAYEALRGLGVEFANEPHVIVGAMWGAHFRDPDGHILSIFGPE
jgi:catechol 2,3-dioxygenase-like lactoylglutathione lyase family enzyme